MISFTLWLAVASQQMCIDATHRRECVRWAEQCLIQEMMLIDDNNARDAAFEQCSELAPIWFWENN